MFLYRAENFFKLNRRWWILLLKKNPHLIELRISKSHLLTSWREADRWLENWCGSTSSGEEGENASFFFHRRSWKKYTVTGAHPCNPDLCSRRKREVPSKHRNSRVAFYFNVSYLASSFWLSGFRRLLFLRTRQVYNFTPRCAYSLPCDQLFSRRRCLVVSPVTCHRRDNADRRFPRRLRLAEALRFLSGVSWKTLPTCSKKLQLYDGRDIYFLRINLIEGSFSFGL